jgi:hypothetical protein
VCNTVTAFHISSSNYGLYILTVIRFLSTIIRATAYSTSWERKQKHWWLMNRTVIVLSTGGGFLLIKIFKAPHASYAIGMLSIDYSIWYRRTMMPATENWA